MELWFCRMSSWRQSYKRNLVLNKDKVNTKLFDGVLPQLRLNCKRNAP